MLSKKEIHMLSNVGVNQLLIDISLHSNKMDDGKDEQIVMIRQHKSKESSSSSNIGEVLLLTVPELSRFKNLLETIEIDDMNNIESRYKLELAFFM